MLDIKIIFTLLIIVIIFSGCGCQFQNNIASQVAKPVCAGVSFYEKQALSCKYKLYGDSVTVEGSIAKQPHQLSSNEPINLKVGDSFYLPSGEEENVSIWLTKLEKQQAYFTYSYTAAPPACETASSCDYSCEFIILGDKYCKTNEDCACHCCQNQIENDPSCGLYNISNTPRTLCDFDLCYTFKETNNIQCVDNQCRWVKK